MEIELATYVNNCMQLRTSAANALNKLKNVFPKGPTAFNVTARYIVKFSLDVALRKSIGSVSLRNLPQPSETTQEIL